MTIQLLTDYPFGRFTIPAGRVVNVFNSATEAGLIASKQAIASAAAVTWTVPDETPVYDQLTPIEVRGTKAMVSTPGNAADLAAFAAQENLPLRYVAPDYVEPGLIY